MGRWLKIILGVVIASFDGLFAGGEGAGDLKKDHLMGLLGGGVFCGGAGRGVWDEWAAAGGVWIDAAVVAAAFSGDVAGIFFAGEPGGVDGVCGGGGCGRRR